MAQKGLPGIQTRILEVPKHDKMDLKITANKDREFVALLVWGLRAKTDSQSPGSVIEGDIGEIGEPGIA